ncbi:MAG: sulfite exporter TauE/SafE family protein [Vicinamibacterales bacterium]
MSPVTFVLLFLVAFTGGALNAVAGGGSFLTLPTLLWAGVPPVSANATSTFAMWPASLASAFAYRGEIARARAWMVRLGAISLVGGLLGGLLLVRTSDESFVQLLPWLMLVAATTFSFGGQITAWARRSSVSAGGNRRDGAATPHAPGPHSSGAIHTVHVPVWTLPLQLLIATYGGYFGGGMGIMMLAAMAIAGMTDMHEMNALKTVLAIAINGVALGAFLWSGSIAWAPGLVMALGGVAGGYSGASLARRVPGPLVRRIVIVVAWGMTVYFFLR